MYKARGKPEDPRNRAAAEQEKGLSEAIRVKRLDKNGKVELVSKAASTIIEHQRELTRRRNNYREFQETYGNKFGRTNNIGRLSKELMRVNAQNLKTSPSDASKRSANEKFDETLCKEVKIPAASRRPPGKIKTVNVEVASLNKEAAILSPLEAEKRNVLSILEKLKRVEALAFEGDGFMDNSNVWASNLTKELETVDAEVDVGNVQLEQINKLLNAARSLKFETTPEKNNSKLYSVQRDVRQKIDANSSRRNGNEKSLGSYKNNKLLLTLNDVNQRIQKMQMKFFNDSRPKYRCMKTPLYSNQSRHLELLFKNNNCFSEPNNRPSGVMLRIDNLKEKIDKLKSSKETSRQGAPSNLTPKIKHTATSPHLYSQAPREKNDFSFNLTDYASDDDDDVENLEQRTYAPNSNGKVEVDVNPIESDCNLSCDFNDYDDELNKKSNEGPNLSDLVYQSQYLMKEFNLDSRHLDEFSMMKFKTIEGSERLVSENKILLKPQEKRSNEKRQVSKYDSFKTDLDLALKNTIFCIEH